jgi:L-rhamnose 1-dehydrogenase
MASPTLPASLPPLGLLKGKTAAITGGTTGIGRAIALGLLRQGCTVVVNHLGRPQDQHHIDSILVEAETIHHQTGDAAQLYLISGDVGDPQTGKKLAESAIEKGGTGRLDIFVSNAGICEFAEFLE